MLDRTRQAETDGLAATVAAIAAAVPGHVERQRVAAILRGAELYRRDRDLPGLLRGAHPAPGLPTIRLLQRARRAEQRRLRAGHWSASRNRVLALSQAVLAEIRARRAGLAAARTHGSVPCSF